MVSSLNVPVVWQDNAPIANSDASAPKPKIIVLFLLIKPRAHMSFYFHRMKIGALIYSVDPKRICAENLGGIFW